MAQGLSRPQLYWLRALAIAKDDLGEGHLASPAKDTLCALERRGYADWQPEPDRRLVVRWTITAGGRALLAQTAKEKA